MRSTELISPAVDPGSAAGATVVGESDHGKNRPLVGLAQRPLVAVARFLDACIATQPQMTRSGYVNLNATNRVDKIEARTDKD